MTISLSGERLTSHIPRDQMNGRLHSLGSTSYTPACLDKAMTPIRLHCLGICLTLESPDSNKAAIDDEDATFKLLSCSMKTQGDKNTNILKSIETY